MKKLFMRKASSRSRSGRYLQLRIGCAMLLAIICVAVPAAISPYRLGSATLLHRFDAGMPWLSSHDISLYKRIISAQERAQWDEADEAMLSLNDQRLLGSLLADRYLHRDYRVSTSELEAWLENFGDMPEAPRIRALAVRKGAAESAIARANTLPEIKGIGRIHTMGNHTMPASWYRGLEAWKAQRHAEALSAFEQTAAESSLTQWQQSAAAFWTYRAAQALKQTNKAESALARASQYPFTFYGMVAGAIQGESVRVSAFAPYVAASVRSHAGVARATAWVQLKDMDRAERELRRSFKQLPAEDRPALISIASQLDLPNLQVRLGQAVDVSAEEKIFASYPMPSWGKDKAFSVDKALLYAISRQESSFATDVRSHAGATGLMQLMPSTADFVWERSAKDVLASLDAGSISSTTQQLVRADLHDPRTNMLIGEAYIRYLMRQAHGTPNLIHVLAGYNAGPGMVEVWNHSSRAAADDPLLYIELIPYKETRHYVLQVLTSYWVYQSLMGQSLDSLQALADNQWPLIQS